MTDYYFDFDHARKLREEKEQGHSEDSTARDTQLSVPAAEVNLTDFYAKVLHGFAEQPPTRINRTLKSKTELDALKTVAAALQTALEEKQQAQVQQLAYQIAKAGFNAEDIKRALNKD